jgi:phosphopantothenoylcysteine decarboxylase/phosphopantothenate--cysteine ligase
MRILVTAGPTREPLDPVRFLSNRSSGKMGYAVAAAAAARGHEVALVSGPVSVEPPAGVGLARVTTAEQMLRAVEERVAWCDALVMAAAVSDWRPARTSPRKLKKERMAATLLMERTPDILASVRDRKGGRIFVGFAAETGDPVAEARRKLRRKGLDLVVANDVSAGDAGFETDTNRVTLVTGAAAPRPLPLMSKREVGERIVDWIEAARRARRRHARPRSGAA